MQPYIHGVIISIMNRISCACFMNKYFYIGQTFMSDTIFQFPEYGLMKASIWE